MAFLVAPTGIEPISKV